MEIKDFKVGEKIYAIPTGNNARRGGSRLVTFGVVKVKRKYVDLAHKGGSLVDSYCPETGATQSAIRAGFSGAGYIFFPSLEAHATYIEGNNMRAMIARHLTYPYDLRRISGDDLRTIHRIIKKTFKE